MKWRQKQQSKSSETIKALSWKFLLNLTLKWSSLWNLRSSKCWLRLETSLKAMKRVKTTIERRWLRGLTNQSITGKRCFLRITSSTSISQEQSCLRKSATLLFSTIGIRAGWQILISMDVCQLTVRLLENRCSGWRIRKKRNACCNLHLRRQLNDGLKKLLSLLRN